jgi:hypothetical protein
MQQENNKNEEKNTVGEVGSSLAGGLNPQQEEEQQVTNAALKGKKVDADLEREEDRPAESE